MRSPDTLVPHLGEDGHTKVLLTGFINKANEFLIGDWAGVWTNSREGERQQSKPCIPPVYIAQRVEIQAWDSTQDHSCPWTPEQQAHSQTQPSMLGEREVPYSRGDCLLTWLWGQPHCQVFLVRQEVSTGLGTERQALSTAEGLGTQHKAEGDRADAAMVHLLTLLPPP